MRVSTLPGQALSTTAHRRGLEPPKLVSELRGDLDWIVMKCLEKDRARRYETANGLAMDVQRHMDNEPVVACPPSRWYEFQKTVQRHKVGFAATAAVIVALASGLALAGWMFVRERDAVREQSRLRQQAQSESAKSQQIATFLQDMLQGVGPSVAAGRDTELLREILDRTVERLDTELTDQPEVEGDLCNVMGSVYFELGQYNEAETMYRRSLELVRQTIEEDNVAVADTLHRLARVFRRRGPTSKAIETERQALAIYEKQLGRQNGKVGASLNVLGFALLEAGRAAEAEDVLKEALEINRTVFGENHPQVGLSLSRLGLVLRDQNKLDESESALREGVNVQRNVPTGVNQFDLVAPEVELGWTLNYLSGVLEQQGKLSEAEMKLSEAVAIMSKVLPKDHNDQLLLICNLAAFHARQGQDEQIESDYRELLATYRALPANRKIHLAVTLSILAEVLQDESKLAEASALLHESAESANLSALNEAAWKLATSPDPELRNGSNALLLAEKAATATSHTNTVILNTLAAAYAEVGDFTEAVRIQREALRHLESVETKAILESHLRLYESNLTLLGMSTKEDGTPRRATSEEKVTKQTTTDTK